MSDKPQLSLQDMYSYLGGQPQPVAVGNSPIESLLNSLGGPSPTSNLTSYDNAASIGADNNSLATGLSNQSNAIFNLVNSLRTESNTRAAEQARQQALAEQAKQQAAMQAKILEAQKKAAINALNNTSKTTGGGGNSYTPTGNYNLTSMPSIPNITPKVQNPEVIPPLRLPKASSKEEIHSDFSREALRDAAKMAPKKKFKRKVTQRDPRKPGIQK